MSIAQQIVEFLRERPEGVDDDKVCEALGLKARQQVNSRCRQLETEGIVVRRRVDGKIRNFLTELATFTPPKVDEPPANGLAPWFWEGNIQEQVVQHLVRNGYQIRSVADTASRQQGIDVVAELNGTQLWVSVKGYPKGTARTNATLQAGHWFKQVIFDILDYRGKSKDVSLGVALPDYPRYRSMAQKIQWFQPVANFQYFWVRENGDVFIE